MTRIVLGERVEFVREDSTARNEMNEPKTQDIELGGVFAGREDVEAQAITIGGAGEVLDRVRFMVRSCVLVRSLRVGDCVLGALGERFKIKKIAPDGKRRGLLVAIEGVQIHVNQNGA